MRGLLVPLDIEPLPPPEVADPAPLPPELEPPRAVALPPVDEPLPVGRRLSCASAGAARASARSAVSEILVDACMAEPRAVNGATLLPEGSLQTTRISSGFQGLRFRARPDPMTASSSIGSTRQQVD